MNVSFYGSLAVLSIGGTALALWLLRDSARSSARWRVQDFGGFTTRGLVISSLLSLYLELLLIRWLSSEIRIFAYFKNFILIACFLGFGVGCYLCRRSVSVAAFLAPLVFFAATVELPLAPLRRLVAALPVLLGATSDMYIWGVGTMKLDAAALPGLLAATIVILPLFALAAITFIPLGQFVGWYLENAPSGIGAYTINILASLAGIALYTGLCFASQPPAIWYGVGGVLAVMLFVRSRATAITVGASFIVIIALVTLPHRGEQIYWSPYQKLSLDPLRIEGEQVGWHLQTNNSWHQKIIDLSPGFVSTHPQLFARVPIELNAYNLPYRFAPRPRRVLILGAGMGNDVAAALRNGADEVTAVEIDPLIVDIGRRLHPEHPYDSPRVTMKIDDARSYVQNSKGRFEAIVFSLLDSQTTSSHFSNIRIDNYVYTVEALTAAKKLLAPDGVFIVKFQVQRPWIAGRLRDLLTTVFGFEPLQLQADESFTSSGRFFVTGSVQKIRAALADASFAAFVSARSRWPIEHVTLTTDDWPYFYQREPGVPTSVAVISLLLVVVSFLAARSVGLSMRSIRVEFFLLGAGFMLLEAQIVSRMALLFGTTWVVNSIVISVLLMLIVLANALVALTPRIAPAVGYAGVLVAIAVGSALPLEAFFFRSFWLKAIVASLVLCLPVFFAGIVFIRRFAEAGFAAEAIGSNLLGSLAGGILESASLWLGLKALLFIAMALYGAAWLASRTRLATSLPDSAAVPLEAVR
jgi:hypothetical protein